MMCVVVLVLGAIRAKFSREIFMRCEQVLIFSLIVMLLSYETTMGLSGVLSSINTIQRKITSCMENAKHES